MILAKVMYQVGTMQMWSIEMQLNIFGTSLRRVFFLPRLLDHDMQLEFRE